MSPADPRDTELASLRAKATSALAQNAQLRSEVSRLDRTIDDLRARLAEAEARVLPLSVARAARHTLLNERAQTVSPHWVETLETAIKFLHANYPEMDHEHPVREVK